VCAAFWSAAGDDEGDDDAGRGRRMRRGIVGVLGQVRGDWRMECMWASKSNEDERLAALLLLKRELSGRSLAIQCNRGTF
jgi:hypothetical protein